MSELLDASTQTPSAPAQASVWTEDTKQRFIEYITKWRGLLLMNGWHINVTFSETAYPDTEQPGGFDDTCSAAMNTNGAYMSGHHLTIYPRMLKEGDHEEQERKIVHELAHIIADPSKQLTRRLFSDKYVTWAETRDTNERLTDWIANIVWALNDKESL